MISLPEATSNDSTHAKAARRALRQLLAAKRQGDADSADLYARALTTALDRHLAQLRAARST